MPPPQTVRIILLDNVLRSKVGGMRDLALTVTDLAKLDIKPRKIYFFDDLSTALSLPDIPGVVAIVLPSIIGEICKINWIAHSQCVYVSGIEMRSFAVINNLRVYLPNTQAPVLSKNVFMANRDLVSFDDIELEELNADMALTVDESMLYNLLALGTFGRRARIPQERIPLSVIYSLLDIQVEDNQMFTVVKENSQAEEDVAKAPSNVAPKAQEDEVQAVSNETKVISSNNQTQAQE